MADDEKDMSPQSGKTALTEDGIPLVVNGERLSKTAIQALREARARDKEPKDEAGLPKEINGPKGNVEPTRYGDWEKNGRVSDF